MIEDDPICRHTLYTFNTSLDANVSPIHRVDANMLMQSSTVVQPLDMLSFLLREEPRMMGISSRFS